VKFWGVSSPSVLGGFSGWVLILAVWTPLLEVVLIGWPTAGVRLLTGFLFGATQTPRLCREGKIGLVLGDFKFYASVLYLAYRAPA
jgi:hypothetical protein